MKILDNLFTFPIILVDGENEEKKEEESLRMALPGDIELDIIYAEAECPYNDFVSVTDRWIPGRKESLEKAFAGKFDACYVVFERSGGFIVPWSKKKFKAELKKFADSHPEETDSTTYIIKHNDNG